MIEEIKCFTFTYAPWDKTFPIRSCQLVIYARNVAEAELIAMDKGWQFFNQDVNVVIREVAQGYRQVEEKQ